MDRMASQVQKRGTLGFLALLMAFMALTLALVTPVQAENSEPNLSNGTVTPRRSYPNIDYLFTVTYSDPDNDAPASMKVHIDDDSYDMEAVDHNDTNYTDGKEYSFKKVMSEGSYSIYYSTDDGQENVVSSDPFTLSVTWDVGHYDIIHFLEEDVAPGLILLLAAVLGIVLLLCIILIIMVLQMRRIAKGLEGKGSRDKGDLGDREDQGKSSGSEEGAGESGPPE